MDSRRVIRFGNSSYVITIPNEWMKANSVSKGDNLVCIEKNNTLIYSVPKKEDNSIIELDMDIHNLKIFNKILISYYLKNYKYIKIKGEKISDKFNEIKIFIEKLPSVEIYEINDEYILLKDISDIDNLDINILIEKMMGIVRTMFEKSTTKDNYNFIMQMDSNINKLSFLGYKVINNNLMINSKFNLNRNAIYYWRIISTLEAIGDMIKRVSRYLKNSTDENIAQIFMMIDSVGIYFNFISKFLQKGINIDNNLDLYLDKKQSLLKELDKYKENIDKSEINIYLVVNQLLKDIIGNIDNFALSIIDIQYN